MHRPELSRRRLAALSLAILAIVLFGLDLVPYYGPRGGLRMVWSFYGARPSSELGAWLPRSQPLDEFAAALGRSLIAWMGVALVLSVVLGLATARALAARLSRPPTLALQLAFIAGWAAALDPLVANFVATRDAQSATRYL